MMADINSSFNNINTDNYKTVFPSNLNYLDNLLLMDEGVKYN